MSQVPPATPGIQHLVNGNRNRVGEGRVDKLETDRFNSIVERITGGMNPSKLAAEVTGAKVDASPVSPAMRAPVGQPAPGPGPRLGSQAPWESTQGGDQSTVHRLANKVAMLEQRLAQYEVFNGNDNDVVVTSNKKPKGPSNRGPESSVFARDIDPKKAKTKDPVDGKPDGPSQDKDAQMAGEHVNILGMSMNEWRELSGIRAPAHDLTSRSYIGESYEDEIDEMTGSSVKALQDIGVARPGPKPPPSDPEKRKAVGMKPLPAARGGSTVAVRGAMAGIRNFTSKGRSGGPVDSAMEELEHELWAEFLEDYDMTPDEFHAFVEAADEANDEEALVAVMELEDEFVEAVEYFFETNLLARKKAQADATAAEIERFEKEGGNVRRVPEDQLSQMARERGVNVRVRGGAPSSSERHRIPLLGRRAVIRGMTDPANRLKSQGISVTPSDDDDKKEALEILWGEWLESNGLSIEAFDALVETAETDEDLATLEELQDLFEAEVAGKRIAGSSPVPGGEAELHQPGEAPVRLQSVARGSVEKAKQGSTIPKFMRRKLGLPIDDSKNEGYAFECDADDDGNPNWAKAMKKFSKKKGGRK